MEDIKPARPSPRLEDGALCWYEGDIFTVGFDLVLTDADGEKIIIQPNDTVEVEIADMQKNIIKTFSVKSVTDNHVTLIFDAETTKLFKKGVYTYDIRIVNDYKTTIANDNYIWVQ